MDGIKHETPDASKVFNKSTRLDLEDIQDHPASLEEINNIEKERAFFQTQYKAECKMHRPQWIDNKANEIFERHHGEYTFEHPKPDWASSLTWQDCVNQASELINAHIESTINAIDQKAQIRQQKIIEEVRFERQILEQEVKEISQTHHRQRMDAYRDFEENKSQYVKDAVATGSKKPKQDAYAAYNQRVNDLKVSRDHNIEICYKNHGFNYNNDQHKLSKQFNMSI